MISSEMIYTKTYAWNSCLELNRVLLLDGEDVGAVTGVSDSL